MKILVIQLARLGDIYQTWPALRAFKRKYPDSEIDLLVRSRFSVATEGLDVLRETIRFDTKMILKPAIQSDEGLRETIHHLETLLYKLNSENYDHVINLSFSPLSSYITSYLSESVARISGYTRHADGYLSIPDDTSAYFYAQVGIEKKNRIHLTDIFATICGESLKHEDWGVTIDENQFIDFHQKWKLGNFQNYEKNIVLQMGASQKNKMLPTFKWKQVLYKLLESKKYRIILVGSGKEEVLAQDLGFVISQYPDSIINLIGSTTLKELQYLIHKCDLFLGVDSMGLQLSSLMKKPSVSLFFNTVNFWETGPTSMGSRVLKLNDAESLTSDQIVNEVISFFDNKQTSNPVVCVKSDSLDKYELINFSVENFEWKLIQALYMQKEFPLIVEELQLIGLQKIYQVLSVAKEQVQTVKKKHVSKEKKTIRLSINILEEVDRVISAVGNLVPSLTPLIRWFETEKIRIAPGSLLDIIEETKEKYQNLELIVAYLLQNSPLLEVTNEENNLG